MHGLLTTRNGTAILAHFSPITLHSAYTRVERLVFLLASSVFGVVTNGYFVASFFVEPSLKRSGNVFLACVGMADFVVTAAVLPIPMVVLLSGEWETVQVCWSLHFITETSTYCYSMYFALVAAESFHHHCSPSGLNNIFTPRIVGLLSTIVLCIGTIMAAVGVFLNLDYDYCSRQSTGNFTFRVTTLIIFHVIPFVWTLFGLILSLIYMHRQARQQIYYRRSAQYESDNSTTILNLIAYISYFLFWIPYLVVTYFMPDTSDKNFYYSTWTGVLRSSLTSAMYSAANRSFRRAFAHLFNYCCCKSSLSGSLARHRRTNEHQSASGEVCVHIMCKAVNIGSPQRAASSSRETQEL